MLAVRCDEVSPELYRQWVENEGRLKCTAPTRSGKPCNAWAGRYEHDPKEYARRLRTACCSIHQGVWIYGR